jgi:voltage-gated sodium channel
MLTLFRVMTFEDWTDVMYETMAVYPLSWIYYLSFIFFTAFAFLNMVIGIVVNVLDEEHEKVRKEAAEKANEPTIADLHRQLEALTAMLEQHQQHQQQHQQQTSSVSARSLEPA